MTTFGLIVSLKELGNNKIIFKLEGRIDAITAPVLEKKVTEQIEASQLFLLFDLAEVDYLSSAGMRLMLSTVKKLKHKGGECVFFSINENVMEVIRIAGFERILNIYLDEEQALNSLKN